MVALLPLAAIGLAYALRVPAQSTTTAAVPTGTPISGDYSGDYRPQVHFSPPKGFMNDPNGLHRSPNGTWHLYYQCKSTTQGVGGIANDHTDNPTDLVAGNQHWGHATSPDLYHWTNQPIALFPPNSTTGVFSGSAVLDPNNTSGFFPNQTDGVVAVYTLNTPTAQVQELAYSFDGGYTFTPYEGNPVLDVGSTQFRDPKVIRYGDSWAMVISFAADYVIAVYTSPDLKEWTHASNITHLGLLGVQYECPNLVSVPIANSSDSAYALTISINPGAPLGGSITQYFPGDFNGTHFVPFDGAVRLSNFGKDDYAGQFFYDEPVSLGWASNWQYTNVVPTDGEGWRSAMTLPRKNYFANVSAAGWDLVQEVYDLSPVLGASLASDAALVNSTSNSTFSTAAYFDANITIPADSTLPAYASLNFTLTTNSSSDKVSGGYFFSTGNPSSYTFWMDRGETSGFDNPFYTNRFSAAQVFGAERIQVVIDRSLLEVYVDGGALVGTMVVFPDEPFTKLEVGTVGLPEGATVEFGAWELANSWA